MFVSLSLNLSFFAGAQNDKRVLSSPTAFCPTIVERLNEYVGVKGYVCRLYIITYSCSICELSLNFCIDLPSWMV